MELSYILFLVAVLSFLAPRAVDAHCRIPCGIYGEERVFGELFENIETIDKRLR